MFVCYWWRLFAAMSTSSSVKCFVISAEQCEIKNINGIVNAIDRWENIVHIILFERMKINKGSFGKRKLISHKTYTIVGYA